MIRTRQAPAALAGPLRELARKAQPNTPPPLLYFMEQEFYAASQTQRTFIWFLDFFALTALVLSAIGLYAILSYSVAQRTKEIGIRMALGSAPRHVLMLVLGEGARVIALGAALGLAAALGLTHLLRAYLFEVSPTDPWALGGAVLLLSAVAFLACFVPARRATRLDPMNALHCE
jgi:ABC-type antimicrobial peptide transport system permease subunit